MQKDEWEKKRDWYEEHEVAPPTRQAHGTEKEINRELYKQRFIKHNWKQEGSYLVCTDCDSPFSKHGAYIGTNRILTGISADGKPQLDLVKISS